jgi:hypothetical protein
MENDLVKVDEDTVMQAAAVFDFDLLSGKVLDLRLICS